MKKTKKARRTRSARGAAPGRRFVKLTRAHLEMSGRLTDDEDKRYALTALCVRRVADSAVVEATNGHMAWRYPAEMVDGEVGVFRTLAGKELADGMNVLIDRGTAKQCLRALPKNHPVDTYDSVYLAVDGGVGVLHTLGGASFRLAHYYDADAKWPDFDEGMIPSERQPLCVGLSVDMLCGITTWLSKHVSTGEDRALVLSFSPSGKVIRLGIDVNREDGPVGALMPFRVNGDPLSKSMPAWRAAFAEAEEKGGKGA